MKSLQAGLQALLFQTAFRLRGSQSQTRFRGRINELHRDVETRRCTLDCSPLKESARSHGSCSQNNAANDSCLRGGRGDNGARGQVNTHWQAVKDVTDVRECSCITKGYVFPTLGACQPCSPGPSPLLLVCAHSMKGCNAQAYGAASTASGFGTLQSQTWVQEGFACSPFHGTKSRNLACP